MVPCLAGVFGLPEFLEVLVIFVVVIKVFIITLCFALLAGPWADFWIVVVIDSTDPLELGLVGGLVVLSDDMALDLLDSEEFACQVLVEVHIKMLLCLHVLVSVLVSGVHLLACVLEVVGHLHHHGLHELHFLVAILELRQNLLVEFIHIRLEHRELFEVIIEVFALVFHFLDIFDKV